LGTDKGTSSGSCFQLVSPPIYSIKDVHILETSFAFALRDIVLGRIIPAQGPRMLRLLSNNVAFNRLIDRITDQILGFSPSYAMVPGITGTLYCIKTVPKIVQQFLLKVQNHALSSFSVQEDVIDLDVLGSVLEYHMSPEDRERMYERIGQEIMADSKDVHDCLLICFGHYGEPVECYMSSSSKSS
jgi:hypothetical protein